MNMEAFKQRILAEGEIISDSVLNLDAILNHQVDPQLIAGMGKELASRFRGEAVTKVLTIESSGISLAYAVALELQVPMVFARRRKTITTGEDVWCVRVPSFTKGMVTDLVIARRLLTADDHVLFVDDIIANGDGAKGIIKIIEQSGARLVGLAVAVEKTFQEGAESLRKQGIRVESLAKLKSLEDGKIILE
jgi:xanthine phosphoribosyltransferase